METRGHDGPAGQALKSEINITPLVDVMLVVLIIFMVVAPLLQQGVGVDLPPAHNVEDASEDESRTLTVVLQGSGRMFLGSDPIESVDLATELQRYNQADPGRLFQVKADRNVAYGEIKRILQAGRAAGFRGASLLARGIDTAGRDLNSGPNPAGQGD